MPNYAIIDTGRNAVQGLRDAWGDWNNADGADFGVRPTSNTCGFPTDAFVWDKPGGESDGTSDSSATRYDSFCGLGMPSSQPPRPVHGTRSPSRCCSRTPTRLPRYERGRERNDSIFANDTSILVHIANTYLPTFSGQVAVAYIYQCVYSC